MFNGKTRISISNKTECTLVTHWMWRMFFLQSRISLRLLFSVCLLLFWQRKIKDQIFFVTFLHNSIRLPENQKISTIQLLFDFCGQKTFIFTTMVEALGPAYRCIAIIYLLILIYIQFSKNYGLFDRNVIGWITKYVCVGECLWFRKYNNKVGVSCVCVFHWTRLASSPSHISLKQRKTLSLYNKAVSSMELLVWTVRKQITIKMLFFKLYVRSIHCAFVHISKILWIDNIYFAFCHFRLQ